MPSVQIEFARNGGVVVNGVDYSAMSADEYQRRFKEVTGPNYKPMEGWIAVGRGSKPWTIRARHDIYGERELIDCQSMYGAANLGQGNKNIFGRVADYLRNVWAPTGNCLENDKQLPATDALIALTRLNARVIFKSAGTEAVETAIKAARRVWNVRHGKPPETIGQRGPYIVAALGGFHGRTLGSTSLFPVGDSSRKGFGPFPDGTLWVPFNAVSALEEKFAEHPDDIAAVLIEPIQGEAGVIVPDDDYLMKVHGLCHAYGALFILDEVQTGFGRTGKNFAFEHYGVTPDVLLLAKALGGGAMPVSAIVGRKDVEFASDPGKHDVLNYLAIDGPGEEGATWSGATLPCVAVLAAIKELSDKNLAATAKRNGSCFVIEMRALQKRYPNLITDVRGKGLMVGVDFSVPGRKLSHALLREGVWAYYTGKTGQTLRFLPPLATPLEVLSDVVIRLERALLACTS